MSRENSQLKNQCLAKPTSTLDPTATSHKGTPSRTRNQGILVVARNETGVPCPIPVASPGVYSEVEQASYDVLAELLIKSIENHFSKEVLSRLSGFAADGPYQASGFRRKLLETLERFSIVFTANGKRQAEISRLPKAHEIYLVSAYILPVSHSYGASAKTREIG